MKTLLLMRHAKSSHDDPALADHDRPLTERGKRDAERMGRWMAAQGLLPEVLISSTAKRARKTADRVAKALNFPGAVEQRGVLYHASPDTWLEAVRNLPDSARCVLCVGHNPGLELFLAWLTGERHEMPTGAVAYITLSGMSWSEIDPDQRNVELEVVWRPKAVNEE